MMRAFTWLGTQSCTPSVYNVALY